MKFTKLTHSASGPTWKAEFEVSDDIDVGLEAIIDSIEPFNYGGELVSRTKESVVFKVYID